MKTDELQSIRIAYGNTLQKLGKINNKIVVLDADLAHATMSVMFQDVFKDRHFNVGVAEANLMGMAAGMSLTGLIPFASTFAMFGTGRAYEQIRNTIAYPNLNVKIAVTHSGVTVGEDGASHQTFEDISLMRGIPNMTVIVPCDAVEAEKAVIAASELNGPVFLRLARPLTPKINDIENYEFEIGKANTLKDGTDVSIFATGLMVSEALKAADVLEKEGISASVINIHTIKPLDTETIMQEARKTGKIITVEEHSVIGGLGSAVSEFLIENHPVKMKRIGIEDTFGQSGTPEELLNHYGLCADNIIKQSKTMLENA